MADLTGPIHATYIYCPILRCSNYRFIFTVRRSYASAVFGVVILSVRHTRAL